MALTPDQQAMLQLMLERGQSYEDIAGLLGGDEASVRARARAALTALGDGTDPDRNVALTDYLLGQADPIGRADAVRHLKDDPDDLELARELSQKLLLVAPGAELPRLPGDAARNGGARSGIPRPRISLPRPESGLSSSQGRTIALLGGGALVLLIAVLGIAGVFSGGSSATSATTSTSTSAGTTTPTSASGRTVTLSPVKKGSGASGTMVFSTAGQQPYFELQVNDLPQPPQGKAYVAWLMFSDKVGHPLSPVADSSGNFPSNGTVHVGPTPLSSFQIPLAQRASAVQVSLSDAAQLNNELRSAVKQTTPIIPYQGTTVLQGTIPGQPSSSGSSGSNGSNGSGSN